MNNSLKFVLLAVSLFVGSCASHQDSTIANRSHQEQEMILNAKQHISKEMPAWQDMLNYDFIVREEDSYFVIDVLNPNKLAIGGGALFHMDKTTLEIVEVWGTQ